MVQSVVSLVVIDYATIKNGLVVEVDARDVFGWIKNYINAFFLLTFQEVYH